MRYSSLLRCEKMSLQSRSEAVGTPGRVPEWVWKRVPFHWTRNGESPMTKRAATVSLNHQLVTVGRSKALAAWDVRCLVIGNGPLLSRNFINQNFRKLKMCINCSCIYGSDLHTYERMYQSGNQSIRKQAVNVLYAYAWPVSFWRLAYVAVLKRTAWCRRRSWQHGAPTAATNSHGPSQTIDRLP